MVSSYHIGCICSVFGRAPADHYTTDTTSMSLNVEVKMRILYFPHTFDQGPPIIGLLSDRIKSVFNTFVDVSANPSLT